MPSPATISVPAPETDPRPPYLRTILRWLATAVSLFVLTMLAGTYITGLLPKVYTATARMQLRPKEVMLIQGIDVSSHSINFASEFGVMESADVLLPIIIDLGLDKAWADRLYRSHDPLTAQDALAHMRSVIRLGYVRGTNIISITASSDMPQEAAAIANALADKYQSLPNGGVPQGGAGVVITTVPASDSQVRILSRAKVPTTPSRPNKSFAFIVTLIVAGFLSMTVASFVEVVILLVRASQRPG